MAKIRDINPIHMLLYGFSRQHPFHVHEHPGSVSAKNPKVSLKLFLPEPLVGNGDRPILNSSHSTFTSTAFAHCRFSRYHLTVCSSPSSQVVCGDHPKSRLALVRSAQVAGTSAG